MISEARKNKLISVAKKRQQSLRLVIENVHDPHNVSAIFRTADAVGVPEVDLVYNIEKFPKIGKKSSASAWKWVNKKRYDNIEKCYNDLREKGYKIYASAISEKAKTIYDFDFTQKTAIVMGNEHRGLSDEAIELADEQIYIPMQGMVQSLNVSVSAALILYEVMRQRLAKEMYDSSDMDKDTFEQLVEGWLKK